jgi:TonB family protein
VTLKLSPQQLKTGQFVYRSEAEDIRMEMEIAGPSGTYVESVRVAGGLPGLPAGPEIAATAAPRINAPERNSLPEPDPAPVAAKPAAPVPAPEKRTAETTAAPGVAAPVVTPEREEPRAFVPPPRVATAGNAVAARSDAPPPDAPQLAAPVNALAAGLPELKLPVPNAAQPNASQPKAAPRFEEYIGPRAIRSVQPAFDASANRTIDNAFSQNHEPHEVQVEVTIDEHGRVTKASKGATTGPFAYLFVDAALAAARRWQFEPASLGGRPVPSKMTLKFAFVRNH